MGHREKMIKALGAVKGEDVVKAAREYLGEEKYVGL